MYCRSQTISILINRTFTSTNYIMNAQMNPRLSLTTLTIAMAYLPQAGDFQNYEKPCSNSWRSMREFGKRVLSVFLVKIMAALFDVYRGGRIVRNLYQRDEGRSKGRRGEGWDSRNLHVSFSAPLSIPSTLTLNQLKPSL